MITDRLTKVSDGQRVAVPGPTVSTDCYDGGPPLRPGAPQPRIGTGEPLSLVVILTAVAAAVGAPGGLVEFISDDDPTLVVAPTVIGSVPLPVAGCVPGARFVVDMPAGTPAQRYLGARYTTPAPGDVTIDAYILPRSHVDQMTYYPANPVIL